MESEFKNQEELKIRENDSLIFKKEEEITLSKKGTKILTDDRRSGTAQKTNTKQQNGAALHRAFRNVAVKSPRQLKREKEQRIRDMIEKAHQNLCIFHRSAKAARPELMGQNTIPAQVSQLDKRMEAAEKKEACVTRIMEYEKAKAAEEENPQAPDTFTADCRALATLTVDSFRIKNDEEFTQNLELNYSFVKMADRVKRNLLKVSSGERQEQISTERRNILLSQISLCEEMKQWMDAKLDLMKNPYYIYLAGKDIENRAALKAGLQANKILGYPQEKAKFIAYLNKLDKLDHCAVNRKKLRDRDEGAARVLLQAVNNRANEELKEHKLIKNKILIRKWGEESAKNPLIKTENTRLTKEDTTFPERVYEQKKEEFLALSLDGLKCSSVEDLLKNVATNAPFIDKALEMQRLLAQCAFDEDLGISNEEIIEMRAKINVILSVQSMQGALLSRISRTKDNKLREESPKEWMKRKGIEPIADPVALVEELKNKYRQEQTQAQDTANKVWTILNMGEELNEVARQDRAEKAQRNTLFWENFCDTAKNVGKATGEVILNLKKLCKDKNLEYRTPEKAVLYYMRGRNADEMFSIYTRYTGSPKQKYLLYKEIVDQAKDEFNPGRFDYSNNIEKGNFLQDLAHKGNLAALLDHLNDCSQEMRAILADNPDLKLSENEIVDEEWHKEAAALSKFSKDKLMPMLFSLQCITDTKEKRNVLSAVSFDELQILFQQKAQILAWMNAQNNLSGEPAATIKKILQILEGFSASQLNLANEYRSYRNAEQIDEEKLRTQQEYRRLRDLETDPTKATQADLKNARNACIGALLKKYSLDEADFFKLDTRSLKALALRSLKEDISEENMKNALQQLISLQKRNPEEEMEDAREEEWDEGEKKVQDFFCALADGLKNREMTKAEKTELFRNILLEHSDTVTMFVTYFIRDEKDCAILSDMRKKMGRPEAQFYASSHRDLMPVFRWIKTKLGEQKTTVKNVETILAQNDADLTEKLFAADEKINGHMDTMFTQMEDSVSEWANQAIGTFEEEPEDEIMTGSLFDQKEEPVEKDENPNKIIEKNENKIIEKKKNVIIQEEEEKDINVLLKKSLTKEKGEGKFITLTMKNYFRHSSSEDKRSMANAMLRDLKPINRKASRQARDARQAGRYLGGMLKGAGPLFQKMMQGIPEELFHPELRRALDDVKSNLAPIKKEYVDEKLNQMKAESARKYNELVSVGKDVSKVTKVEKITIIQSLGAASVAETFLCKIYGKNLPTSGKDVVIKILRPNLKDRLEREKKILRVAARCTDDSKLDFDQEMQKPLQKEEKTQGMESNNISQVNKILEELDMRIEVDNAKKGYDTYHSDDKDKEVDSVKVNEDLPVMEDCYALDKAEGMTVERYLKQIRKKRSDILADFIPKGGRIARIGPNQMELYEKKRALLLRELENVMSKQKMLIKTAEKWTEQAIFGSNFYHGDMHAGNIMISDNKVTIIDFGNATKLSSNQKNHIMAMTSCTTDANLAEDFLWSFTMLLPPIQNEPKFSRKDHENEAEHPRLRGKGKEFLGKIKEILSMKDKNDPDNDQSGEKISLILKTAQEMGLQLPPEVENFSKSQLRLQNTITSFNDAVEEIRSEIKSLDRMAMSEKPNLDLYKKIHNDANSTNRRQVESVLLDTLNLFVPVAKDEFEEQLKQKDSKSREAFENNYINSYSQIVKMENGEWVSKIDLSQVSKWRLLFEKVKKLAPKSEEEEPSSEYIKLRGKLSEAVSDVLGPFANSSKAGVDPLPAFGGVMYIFTEAFTTLTMNNLEGFETILKLFENEVPTAVELMQNYHKLRESQDKIRLFDIFNSQESEEKELRASIYENYVKLVDSRLQSSEVMKDIKLFLNRDYEYKVKPLNAIEQIPVRLHQQKGDKTKTEEAYKAYLDLVHSLKVKYFEKEMEELEKEEAEEEKYRRAYLEANKRLHLEQYKLSAKEKADLEKVVLENTKAMEPHEKRISQLESIVDKYEKKISPEEKKALKEATDKVQKEYDRLRMNTAYLAPLEDLEKELDELSKEKDGGMDLKRAYEEYHVVQLKDMELRKQGKPVGDDIKTLRKEKEKVLLQCWQRVNTARLKRHYDTAFKTTETITSKLTDYMKVTGDVVKRNIPGALMSLAKVSTSLVGRLKS